MRFDLGATPWGVRVAPDKMAPDKMAADKMAPTDKMTADGEPTGSAAAQTFPACAAKADARWRHALDALTRLRAPRAGDSVWPAAHALIAAVRRAQHAQPAAPAGLGCVRCRAVPLEPVTWECGHTSCRGCVDARGCARCGLRTPTAHLEVNVLVRSLLDKWFPREVQQARLRKQAAHFAAHKMYAEAGVQLDAAIDADPRDHVALAMRSRAMLRMGRTQDALRDADAAVTARPDWGEGHYRRGLALASALRHEEALCALLAAAAADPDRDVSADVATALARVELGSLLSRRGLAALRQQLERAQRACPGPAAPAAPALDPVDLECVLCARLLLRPLTTPCGHTYCAACLDRCLDYGCACPLCKTSLTKYLTLGGARATTDWLDSALALLPPASPPPPLASRCPPAIAEQLPLFVCTTSFPSVACPLFVYEPRYRAMVRAVVCDGSRTFGMVPSLPGGRGPAEFGTLQVIADWVLLSDGCSIVTTTGTRRFRVVSRGETDGYHTAGIELLHDHTPPHLLQGLVELHNETRAIAVRWLRESVSPALLAEISRSFGPLPALEPDWLESPDGPSWAWWLLAVLPLGPELQLSILATTDLAKRLRAIQKTLEHIQRDRRPRPAVAAAPQPAAANEAGAGTPASASEAMVQ